MNTENEIKDPELTAVVGGRVAPHNRKTLDVFVAARYLLEPDHFWQLSIEDQKALKEHATEAIWLETFLNNGVKKGIAIIIKAREAGMV